MKQFKIFIFIFACLLYANTIGHDFVLDDKIVVTHNQFTKKGLNGLVDSFLSDSMTGFFGRDKSLVAGGRYRPLSMAVHAIQFEFFAKNPLPYHLMNILLYGFLCLLLFQVLLSLFKNNPEALRWYHPAVLITLLYASHPLHTEVVANIKSLDELLSISFALLAWHHWLKHFEEAKLKAYVYPALFMFLSLLSKESSIAFVLMIPLSGVMLLSFDAKKSLKLALPLAIAALAYVGMRYAVIGSAKLEVAKELMNNPFLNAGSSEKFATIFYTYFEYFRLLILPHPLTHDYYPKHIPIVGWGELKVILALLLHALIVFLVIRKRQNKQIVFWVLFYFANFFLYSNLIFNIGTFMNERFLFVSSLSFCFFLVFLLGKTAFIKPKIRGFLVVGLVLVFAALSVNRNPAWASDRSLALSDVEVSTNSAKAQMAAGSAYLDWAKEAENEAQKQQLLLKSREHLQRSLSIYPVYFPPMILMGNALAEGGQFKESLLYYANCLKLNPGHTDASNNTLYVAQQSVIKKDFKTALNAYELLLTQEKKAEYYSAIGEIYGKELGDLEQSFEVLSRGLKAFPDHAELNQKAGVVRAIQGRPAEALPFFMKALEENKENAHLYLNIGLAYRALGQMEKAEEFISKAVTLDPSLRKG